ncbi:multiprotein-bridging factor 1 family protein [Cryptosporangium sp. NPDC051539]|uniref:multiprotein-bridging factor 1 family protein n=1 Tax=Cryptosporangium sp. NPDC051539 TaxID=3363962 RepID=UPI0037A2DD0F
MAPETTARLQDLGTRIRVRREGLGLTLEQAAKAAEMSITTWGDAERGQKRPQGGTLRRMEQVLKYQEGSLSRFLTDGTEPQLWASVIAGQLYPKRATKPDEHLRIDVNAPGSPDSSESIFALAANEDLPLTPEERAEIARIAAAVWRRNNPQDSPDA